MSVTAAPKSLAWNGDPDVLAALAAREHASDALLAATQDPLAGQAVVLDTQWRIVAVNAAWRAFAEERELSRLVGVGKSLRRACRLALRRGFASAATLLEGMDAIDGGAHAFSRTARSSFDGRYQHLSLTPLDTERGRFAMLIRQDVNDLFDAGRNLTQLRSELGRVHARLARVREEERERIARELHDGVAQWLVGIKLGLAHLRRVSDCPMVRAAVADLGESLTHFETDVRSLTLQLHPPTLGHGGLHQALRTLCVSFAPRSELRVALTIEGNESRAIGAIETAAYRVVQEALSNAHKHAGATRVRVRLSDRGGRLVVAVVDDGRGLGGLPDPANDHLKLGGFGIPGMIARVSEAGGRIAVHSLPGNRGTSVAAIFPRR